MKKIIKNTLYEMLSNLPQKLFNFIAKHIGNILDIEEVERRRIKKFALKLIKNFDGECKKIAHNKRIMEIYEGNYTYKYFNICYLNNVISLVLYSLYCGCIPEIRINANQSDTCNNWDWYFIQPIELGYFPNCNYINCTIVKCDRKNSTFNSGIKLAFDLESDDFKIWKLIYNKFVIFNKSTQNYLEKELRLLDKGATIGTIIRGTDYVTLKPKGHPIQPDMKILINLLRDEMKTGKYQYIYVATEEKKLFDMISMEFGEEIVLSNKRVYYDVYYCNEPSVIGKIHFDRENDNYLKGIEYLSSLNILSKCNSIIGGNCGGMVYAALMAPDNSTTNVINCGLYE